jgi:hypothetical protein
MIIRVGGESLYLMRRAPLRWGVQSPPLTRSSVVHPSMQDARTSHSTRVG